MKTKEAELADVTENRLARGWGDGRLKFERKLFEGQPFHRTVHIRHGPPARHGSGRVRQMQMGPYVAAHIIMIHNSANAQASVFFAGL